MRVEGVREHQAALQAIADANGGNRFSGLPGHDASVDYVVDRLEAAGYDPEVQTWTVNGVPGSKVPGNFTIPAPAGPEGTVGGGGADYGHGTTS